MSQTLSVQPHAPPGQTLNRCRSLIYRAMTAVAEPLHRRAELSNGTLFTSMAYAREALAIWKGRLQYGSVERRHTRCNQQRLPRLGQVYAGAFDRQWCGFGHTPALQ
jgi:hypothetical protein